jgi:hypothetical protein
VRYIRLQIGGQGQAGNSISVTTGSSVAVTATVVDSLNNIINSPPLTWSTTNPDVAAFASTTTSADSNTATTRNNVGGATLFASCTPPSCNIGVLPALPIYASDGTLPNGQNGFGAISVDATSTATPPTYVAWAATTGCNNQPGCTSALFSIIPGITPIGAIVSVPRTPNSMMFNHQSSSRLYLGSDQGLMFIDVTSSTGSVSEVSGVSTPCNVALCGKVLTISNDGKLVVISDPATGSSPSQIYIYNADSTTAASTDLIIPGETATAAAFSPDQLKLFILTDTGKMYIYSTVDALSSVPIATTASDVKFSADGSFAYVAGTPASAISAYSTCSSPTSPSVDLGSVATSSTPLEIFPSPAVSASPTGLTQPVLALEPPNVDIFSALFTQVTPPVTLPNTPVQTTCNPPNLLSFTQGPSYNLGQGNFVPIEAQLVKDGAELVIVGRKLPAVLMFNVAGGTTTSIPLVGNPDPLSASVSTDGSQVYVAACDQYASDNVTCTAGSVHIVNTVSQGDLQQVPYVNINQNNNPNMCNGLGTNAPFCVPNLIAVKPQ